VRAVHGVRLVPETRMVGFPDDAREDAGAHRGARA
jgi:hypothetical protein